MGHARCPAGAANTCPQRPPAAHAGPGDGPLFNRRLLLHRSHTALAPLSHVEAGGKAWDTVKPLRAWAGGGRVRRWPALVLLQRSPGRLATLVSCHKAGIIRRDCLAPRTLCVQGHTSSGCTV